MVRTILGVIVGFIVWSILWVGGDAILASLSPGWIGAYSLDAERAFVNNTQLTHDNGIAAIHLLRSFVTSIVAGYLAALVAGESRRTTLVLGIILLVVGAAVEIFAWRLAPAWYHIIFLAALIPMTILGGKLRRSTPAV